MLDVQGSMFHLAPVTIRLVSLFPFAIGMAYAQPLSTPRLSCEVENTAKATVLTAKAKGTDAPVKLRIDWLSGTEPPEDFRNHPAKANRVTSTHRLGKTTLTRTVLVSEAADCILIHVQSDQPGAVHFTTRFVTESPVEIHERRQIILNAKEIHAHAWIIPFESDVSDDGKAITLPGEGEALIILNLTADPATSPVSNTLARLAEMHDPGHTSPNPNLIWQAVGVGVEK